MSDRRGRWTRSLVGGRPVSEIGGSPFFFMLHSGPGWISVGVDGEER
jgi:hypothetical protein